MSGFLTMAFDQMKRTVEAIKEAGLRDQVKIMIGGAIMDDKRRQVRRRRRLRRGCHRRGQARQELGGLVATHYRRK